MLDDWSGGEAIREVSNVELLLFLILLVLLAIFCAMPGSQDVVNGCFEGCLAGLVSVIKIGLFVVGLFLFIAVEELRVVIGIFFVMWVVFKIARWRKRKS